jgi:hypothetical protein
MVGTLELSATRHEMTRISLGGFFNSALSCSKHARIRLSLKHKTTVAILKAKNYNSLKFSLTWSHPRSVRYIKKCYTKYTD